MDGVARLCVMNLFLHGIGGNDCPVRGGADSLAKKPSIAYEMVLTNPPFGKKSSFTIVNDEGEASKADISYVRDDFWATTSNKQIVAKDVGMFQEFVAANHFLKLCP